MKTRRALLTGATGQDGSYLLDELLSKSWEVHAINRGNDPLDRRGVTNHEGDLEDHRTLYAVVSEVQPDFVFNLGGLTSVATSWDEPVTTGCVTGIAVAALLDACWTVQEQRGEPIAFVQASSAEIFGAPTETPQTERTSLSPISPYGAAKAYGHQMVRIYRGRGLHASNAILYNHESPRRPSQFVTRKITSTVARIAAGVANELVLGDLSIERDWGWAPDYVAAILKMATMPFGDDYVIATGELHSIEEFVATAFEVAGIDEWRRYVRSDAQFMRPAEAARLVGDPSKAETNLGWSRTVDFRGVVERMVASDMRILSEETS